MEEKQYFFITKSLRCTPEMNPHLNQLHFNKNKKREKQGLPAFLSLFFEVQLIYNVVFISGVQQSDSVIQILASTLFWLLFLYRSLQGIE